MSKPWESESCEAVQAYFSVYPVPVAAALWCGIPASEAQSYIRESCVEVARGIYSSPFAPCIEPRCRAIHHAIEIGVLPCSRENGRLVQEHVAPERRHVSRKDLKEWIAKELPTERPAFLFGSEERDAEEMSKKLRNDLEGMEAQLHQQREQCDEIRADRDRLQGELELLSGKNDVSRNLPLRAETTYLNIIGALLDLLLAKSPSENRRALFPSQAAVITALESRFPGKEGLSQRTLHDKFAAAKRSLDK